MNNKFLALFLICFGILGLQYNFIVGLVLIGMGVVGLKEGNKS
jgi:ABC-type transport system involved in multi-copper enzyme maturation permease subunit